MKTILIIILVVTMGIVTLIACKKAPDVENGHDGATVRPSKVNDYYAIIEPIWLGVLEAEEGHMSAFSALNESEKVLFNIYYLEMEVNNGGFYQYFYNTSGDFTNDAIDALGKIRATSTQLLLQEAVSVFPSGPSSDHERRIQQLEALTEEQRATLNQLDDRFFKYPDNLASLSLAYWNSQTQNEGT